MPRRVCFFCAQNQEKEDVAMKLVGDLKDKVEKAETREEAKKVIEEAGMKLTEEEMDQVAGGIKVPNQLGHLR